MLKGNKDGLFFLAQRRQDAKKNKQIFLRLCFLLSLREISYPFYALFYLRSGKPRLRFHDQLCCAIQASMVSSVVIT